MDRVTDAISPLYPGYDRTFCYWSVTGTWRPLPGSDPYNGCENEITVAKEVRVEFAVRDDELQKAISAIISVHPYEEPAIDIVPMIAWRSVTPSDGR